MTGLGQRSGAATFSCRCDSVLGVALHERRRCRRPAVKARSPAPASTIARTVVVGAELLEDVPRAGRAAAIDDAVHLRGHVERDRRDARRGVARDVEAVVVMVTCPDRRFVVAQEPAQDLAGRALRQLVEEAVLARPLERARASARRGSGGRARPALDRRGARRRTRPRAGRSARRARRRPRPRAPPGGARATPRSRPGARSRRPR